MLLGCQTGDVASPAQPRASGTPQDAFVLLSGGGTPTSNNYSQYVQAQGLATYLQANYPTEAVWIFFGAGNREGEKAVLADVYRQVNRDGLLLDTWVPGALARNRAATRENFLRALRTEILPRIRNGGTLYLLVGDHGELTGGKSPESAITMWGLRPDTSRPNGWSTARNYELTVSELRTALAEGLGAGRVVFAMTQCHSGGFHELGVPAEVQPPDSWFLSRPNWLTREPKGLPLAAGFTATDAASIAAGCDPAPDPETWFGYERFFPEALLGRDLLSQRELRDARPLASFAAAHAAAVLIDETIDKPRSTSEHYLERWASLIDARIAHELLLTPTARAALDAYTQGVETGNMTAGDPAWRRAFAVHEERIHRMATQNPATERLLIAGTRAQLEKPPTPRVRRRPEEPITAGRLSRSQAQAWREVIRPAWTTAVESGSVPQLPGVVVAFEKKLLRLESRGRPAGFSDDWSERALTELYWSSSFAIPEKFDGNSAEASTTWAARRRAVILAWAAAASDDRLREAAAQFGEEFRRPRTVPPAGEKPAIDIETAAARTLFQRRTLAAWAFLLATNHQGALARLTALQELERTPLPHASPP